LVETKDIEALNLELDSRLDDLFGETDILLPDVEQEDSKEEYPLAELKNSILSIDWEITEEVLDKLVQQIQDLLTTYEDDKIVKTFLQILNSLGNYIRIHRGKAPPKTFKILNSVFSSLDKVVLSEDMTESAKKKLLRTEMKNYKKLRNLTAKSPKAAAKEKVNSEETAESDVEEKEPIIRLEETSKDHDDKQKKAAPETNQDEPALALEIDAKEEAPLLDEDEPELELSLPESETAKAPDTRAKAESDTREKAESEARAKADSEAREKAESEARAKAESEARAKAESEARAKAESEARAKADSEARAQAESEARAKAESETPSKAEPDPALATLAEAVDEIKRYIHIEIKALKKEIRLLRKQK